MWFYFRQLHIVFFWFFGFFYSLGCQNDTWIIILHCSRDFLGSSYPPLDAVKPSNHQGNKRLPYKYPKVSWGRTTKLNDNSLPCNVLDILVWCKSLSWLDKPFNDLTHVSRLKSRSMVVIYFQSIKHPGLW